MRYLIAVLFPFAAVIGKRVGLGIFLLLLQMSGILWVVASIVAVLVVHDDRTDERAKRYGLVR